MAQKLNNVTLTISIRICSIYRFIDVVFNVYLIPVEKSLFWKSSEIIMFGPFICSEIFEIKIAFSYIY